MQKNQKFLAFDIGGTKIACAVINERGKILSEPQKFDTPKTTEAINLLLKSIISQHEDEIDAVAIATAGEVSNERSRIISSVGNMAAGYRDMDFASLSAKPVLLENINSEPENIAKTFWLLQSVPESDWASLLTANSSKASAVLPPKRISPSTAATNVAAAAVPTTVMKFMLPAQRWASMPKKPTETTPRTATMLSKASKNMTMSPSTFLTIGKTMFWPVYMDWSTSLIPKQ